MAHSVRLVLSVRQLLLPWFLLETPTSCPPVTPFSVLSSQVCPLVGDLLRQLDVKLLKGLMGECLVCQEAIPGLASPERGALPPKSPMRPTEGCLLMLQENVPDLQENWDSIAEPKQAGCTPPSHPNHQNTRNSNTTQELHQSRRKFQTHPKSP